MANLTANLPVPNTDGVGASANTSLFGIDKTLTLDISGRLVGLITVEISNDAGASWQSFKSFTTGGAYSLQVVAERMRIRRSGIGNFSGNPGSVNADIGAPEATPNYASLAVPAGNGDGAATNISAFGNLMTVVIAGPFAGAITLEVSDDSYQPVRTFNAPGIYTIPIVGQLLRVRRRGINAAASPGTPTVSVGAVTVGGGGGGGGGNGTQYVFVYQPGGTQADNVYTSWSDLVAAMSAVTGFKILEFDNTQNGGANIEVPAGTWDMTDVSWEAAIDFLTVDILEGAVLTNLCFISLIYGSDFFTINCLATATSPITLTGGAFIVRGSTLINAPNGAPLVSISSGTPRVQLWEGARFKAFEAGAGSPILDVASGANPQVWLFDRTFIGDNSIRSVAGSTVTVVRGAGNGMGNQPNLAGTLFVPSGSQFPAIAFDTTQAVVNGNRTATVSDVGKLIQFNTTAAQRTYTLPPNARFQMACMVAVRNALGANNVVVSPGAGDTINGGASYTLAPGRTVIFAVRSSGTAGDWLVISDSPTTGSASGGSYVKLPVDLSGGPANAQLPNITAATPVYYVYDQQQNAGANLGTILPDGSDSIAGAPTSLVLDTDGAGITLAPDATTNTWFIAGGQGYTAT